MPLGTSYMYMIRKPFSEEQQIGEQTLERRNYCKISVVREKVNNEDNCRYRVISPYRATLLGELSRLRTVALPCNRPAARCPAPPAPAYPSRGPAR